LTADNINNPKLFKLPDFLARKKISGEGNKGRFGGQPWGHPIVLLSSTKFTDNDSKRLAVRPFSSMHLSSRLLPRSLHWPANLSPQKPSPHLSSPSNSCDFHVGGAFVNHGSDIIPALQLRTLFETIDSMLFRIDRIKCRREPLLPPAFCSPHIISVDAILTCSAATVRHFSAAAARSAPLAR